MGASDWKARFKLLANSFTAINGYAPLAAGIDDGIEPLLTTHLAQGRTKVNRRFVEDLVNDCVVRVANCLILREKAYEIEVRAVGDAVSHFGQSAIIETNNSIRELLADTQPRTAANATRARVNGDEVSFESDETVWTKVKDLQAALAKQQTDLVDVQAVKAQTPGNGSNYVERFTSLKELFDVGIAELYGRAMACASALKSIYDIDCVVPAISQTGYLNQLALWGQKASDALDKELSARYIGEISLSAKNIDNALVAPLSPKYFSKAWGSGELKLHLSEDLFEQFQMTRPLLRSVRVQAVTGKDEARFWSVVVALPNTDLTDGDEVFPCKVSTSYAAEPGEIVFGAHNLRPHGDWVIRRPVDSSTGELNKPEDVVDFVLHLRVSYKRLGVI